ncbi:DNA-binding transcriptional LysR family regulator [Cupriavidus metallidurans]|uniref:LysR substrate-binding domain-containing protein n=1 Tax=Cupriavidus TaxID=106589 RepID=UPI000492F9B6|nr:LysR substrate-binding domain-containing protein [Cupriavidus metallidurans]AVA34124.1 LysR family transcriptional regulator [Cupriavidus metallidurans]KWW35052.1 HTH-type transcriptional regulator GltR [Cupriavidus metallidurans]MDE4922237.1 LysR substrate-binding domain-containing protein [Cupriavidus metallidurans]UBM08306.1 LysR family transcriptional regulator [Cupriavidus metallidurans]
MELAELEIFRAVAREQSITRAARVLDRVQSNVTTRVKQLEESLGVALFQRDSKKMTLTPEGQRLLGYAEQMLALAEEARQSMRADTPSGTLRVGSMESSAATLLPKPLGRYHAAWPDVELDLTTGTTQSLVDAVLDRRLDCAVVAHPGKGAARDLDIAEMGAGLEGTFIRTEELVLVLPATHPKVRDPQDVTLRHLAAFARGCTYRRCAEEWLEEGGDEVRRSLSVMEMPSYHAILASVAAGSAVGIVPRALLALHPDHAEFQTVPVRPAHTFLVKRAGFTTSAFEAFQRELRHV